MSLIRKHVAVLQAWACLDLVSTTSRSPQCDTKSRLLSLSLLQASELMMLQ